MLFGGLVGATPGLIIANLSGENLLVAFGGFLLIVVGFVVGAVRGWRRSGWLNRQGVIGAVLGLVPGVILWPLDLADGPIVGDLHYKGVVTFVLIGGFLAGLLIGNRLGDRTDSSWRFNVAHIPNDGQGRSDTPHHGGADRGSSWMSGLAGALIGAAMAR